jgi:hypothetical protein
VLASELFVVMLVILTQMTRLLCCWTSSPSDEEQEHSVDEHTEMHHRLEDEDDHRDETPQHVTIPVSPKITLYKTVDLNPQVTVLTQDEFQSKWKELPHTLFKEYKVKRRETTENELENLEEVFSKRSIFTLASGVVSHTYKLYLYAEQVSTEENEKSTWLLMEVVISMDTLIAHIRMKTDDQEYEETFLHYIESILSDIVTQ